MTDEQRAYQHCAGIVLEQIAETAQQQIQLTSRNAEDMAERLAALVQAYAEIAAAWTLCDKQSDKTASSEMQFECAGIISADAGRLLFGGACGIPQDDKKAQA